jgi:hypothetical protein
MKHTLSLTLIAGASLLLSACATDKTMFYKDGQQVQVLTCTGPTFTGCLEKASNICKENGYEILDRVSVRQSGMLSSTDHKEIVIACKVKAPVATITPNPVAPVSTEPTRTSR